MEPASTSGKIVLLLRKNGSMSISELASALDLSKMAILKHLSRMEYEGKAKRGIVKKKVGRPEFSFSLTENGVAEFQPPYEQMLDHMVKYLRDNGGRELVEGFLRERYNDLREELYEKIRDKPIEQQVEILRSMREKSGYMAEARKLPGGGFEMTEYRCPIFTIAERFPVACSAETKMFSDLLGSPVESTHRQVQGNNACRFFIKAKSTEAV